jgi:bacterioferritin
MKALYREENYGAAAKKSARSLLVAKIPQIFGCITRSLVTTSGKERCVLMKGSPKVIEQLNRALHEELAAISQYFVHSEMDENWGYDRLADHLKKQSIDEMKHAEALIERILYLDGVPSLAPVPLAVGKNVKTMIESDLNFETGAIALYNAAIQIASDEKDNGTRDLFIKLLKDEEGHADFLETQLHQIAEIGYERYLITQTSEGK